MKDFVIFLHLSVDSDNILPLYRLLCKNPQIILSTMINILHSF